MEPGQTNGEGIAFGRFRASPRQRCLFAGDQPVQLGARAFDLLLALLAARGTVIGKDALMSRVWPRQIVTEDNLRVQMSALRDALGPDRDLIRTVAGRGYQFIDDSRLAGATQPGPRHPRGPADIPSSPTNLPEPISELIGRGAELQEITALARRRLVTLTGPGGVGKTRLALEVARKLLPEFADGVWVAELAAASDAGQVAAAIAAAVGVEVGTGAVAAEQIAAALGSKTLLIVLDTCEHVIDAAAHLAETVLRLSRNVHVIATSREALNVEGEWVYRVDPLSMPKAAVAADDRAVALFLARARATDLDLSAEQSAAIARICRRLDDIPLAIELAAARAATLGLYTLADRLDDHLQLLTCGRRTAPPRHQTLRATLDWSFSLLTSAERSVLCRLAGLGGVFTLEEAKTAAAGDDLDTIEVTTSLANLVSKSLVAKEVASGYRLLETTRAYALEKRAESDKACPAWQHRDVSGRHARAGAADRRFRRGAVSLQFAA